LRDLHTVERNQQVRVGLRGAVYIDPETGETMRLTTEAMSVPPKFTISESRSAVDYGSAKIGGRVYYLPKRSDLAIVSRGILSRNVIEFGEYRKFSSEATLTFK
jgi:hypothetical protein